MDLLVQCWIERVDLCDGKLFSPEDPLHTSASCYKGNKLKLETTSDAQRFLTVGSDYRLREITQTVPFNLSLPRRVAVKSPVS